MEIWLELWRSFSDWRETVALNHLVQLASVLLTHKCTHRLSPSFSVSVDLGKQLNFVAPGFVLLESQKSCHWYSQCVCRCPASTPSSQHVHTPFTPSEHMALLFITSVVACLVFLISFLCSWFCYGLWNRNGQKWFLKVNMHICTQMQFSAHLDLHNNNKNINYHSYLAQVGRVGFISSRLSFSVQQVF